jgi:hypothetical protein
MDCPNSILLTKAFRTITKPTGLRIISFFPRSLYKNQETGELFFGGINGITYFDPEKIEKSSVLPDVALTDSKLFN